MKNANEKVTAMQLDTMNHELETLRAAIGQDHTDPRDLHDTVQRLIAQMEAMRVDVPLDVRELAADLEAEVVEDFYDNLPV